MVPTQTWPKLPTTPGPVSFEHPPFNDYIVYLKPAASSTWPQDPGMIYSFRDNGTGPGNSLDIYSGLGNGLVTESPHDTGLTKLDLASLSVTSTYPSLGSSLAWLRLP